MEWCKISSRPDLPGVEVLHARFQKHRYVRHSHEHAVIGLVEGGVQSYLYRGVRHRTGPDGIFVVNPDEAHTGEAGDSEGYTYRSLYPTQGFLDGLLTSQAGLRLCFRDAVVYDSSLSQKLREVHLAIWGGAPRVTCESLLLQMLVALLGRNGVSRPRLGPLGPERDRVKRVRAFLDAHPNGDIALASLARLAQLSPFHLAHAFVRDVGSPIHVYAESVRMRRARQLLKLDMPLAQIALELGFADQSHFSRRFKQQRGVTPSQYRRAARFDNTRPAPKTML